MKKTNVFGLLMAVALVSLCSSWLNGVVVNATTAASTAFTQISEVFDALMAPKSSQQNTQETSDQTASISNGAPPSEALNGAAVETEDGSIDIAAYLADLESTQNELIESVSKLQAEIELLNGTANMSTGLRDERPESDELDEDGKRNKAENAPEQAELTDAQIWQQDYRNYQEWARQYEVKE